MLTFFEEKITIDKEEYKSLLEKRLMLMALEVVGVDNWIGYEYALDLYEETKDEE